MMAPEYYVFTGERIPDHVTHVRIGLALTVVPARAFQNHPSIEEVICHDGVEIIQTEAFECCPRLQRVIMPGVKIIGLQAFNECRALTYIECGKVERIGQWAFRECRSLSSIDMPSIKIVQMAAFYGCWGLVNVKFGNELESIRGGSFFDCRCLERISLPLKDGMVIADNSFTGCEKLESVNLVEGAVLHETVAGLLIEEWKNDMNEEIDSINQILPNTFAGNAVMNEAGGKAREIRSWISSVLRKIVRYKAHHHRYLNVAADSLQLALPNDILFKNILPFLELSSHSFDGEN